MIADALTILDAWINQPKVRPILLIAAFAVIGFLHYDMRRSVTEVTRSQASFQEELRTIAARSAELESRLMILTTRLDFMDNLWKDRVESIREALTRIDTSVESMKKHLMDGANKP